MAAMCLAFDRKEIRSSNHTEQEEDFQFSVTEGLSLTETLIRAMATITNRKWDRKSGPLFDATIVPRLQEIHNTQMEAYSAVRR